MHRFTNNGALYFTKVLVAISRHAVVNGMRLHAYHDHQTIRPAITNMKIAPGIALASSVKHAAAKQTTLTTGPINRHPDHP